MAHWTAQIRRRIPVNAGAPFLSFLREEIKCHSFVLEESSSYFWPTCKLNWRKKKKRSIGFPIGSRLLLKKVLDLDHIINIIFAPNTSCTNITLRTLSLTLCCNSIIYYSPFALLGSLLLCFDSLYQFIHESSAFQDTVVALEALSKFSIQTNDVEDLDLRVELCVNDKRKESLRLNKQTALTQKVIEVRERKCVLFNSFIIM